MLLLTGAMVFGGAAYSLNPGGGLSATVDAAAGFDMYMAKNEIVADVDANGAVSLTDVSIILKKIAGWDVKFNMTPVVPVV